MKDWQIARYGISNAKIMNRNLSRISYYEEMDF
jgi:hypothetical protein